MTSEAVSSRMEIKKVGRQLSSEPAAAAVMVAQVRGGRSSSALHGSRALRAATGLASWRQLLRGQARGILATDLFWSTRCCCNGCMCCSWWDMRPVGSTCLESLPTRRLGGPEGAKSADGT